jgi:hypothetical protein
MQEFLISIAGFLCYYSSDMDRRRLFLYLLLNVFVSACVTSAILYWYHRNYREATLSSVPPASLQSNQPVPAATLDPEAEVSVTISSVIGAGILNAEWVVVRNSGGEPLNLANWQLRDSDRNVFVFPNLTLNPNGAVQVHTIAGTNTVIDLYWGLSAPIWESGEEAQLLDPAGNVRAMYRVP